MTTVPTISTTQSRTPWIFPRESGLLSARWPRICAEQLRVVREPLRWSLRPGRRAAVDEVTARLRWASRGAAAEWDPPEWLRAHQRDAAVSVAGRLAAFGGAILADAVGLGKTYIALSVATRYRRPCVIVPAPLVEQWRRVAGRLGIPIRVQADQSLSRGGTVYPGDLLVVDEAHRFRNPATRRYDVLARQLRGRPLLLLTATPVVNHPADLVALLSLFLPDNGLAFLGVSSLEGTLAARDYERLAQCATAVMVARSPGVLSASEHLPAVMDASVVRAPPVEPAELNDLLALVDQLSFPTLGDTAAAALLSLHLRHRLTSSLAAFGDTLARHAVYLDRALESAARGESLSRHEMRALLGADDELQLTFDLRNGAPSAPALDSSRLTAERLVLEVLRSRVRRYTGKNPKATALAGVLQERGSRKTIVFTSAVATARELAKRMGWRRLAVVSGQGAWVASGAIGFEEALALFSPRARGAADPAAAAIVNTLIATDLVSEGLDLQDADAIIHYDLPWTPLRLEQRLGRVARLGSPHSSVSVWWFVPPPALEPRLDLLQRLDVKLRHQLALGVPASSRVGKARTLGTLFRWRERFSSEAAQPADGSPCFAVVSGPPSTACALRWSLGAVAIPELIVVEDGREVTSEARRSFLVDCLTAAAPGLEAPPAEQVRSLRRIIRGRLRAADRGPTDDLSRRLARNLIRRAAGAGLRRDVRLVNLLDRALDHLSAGLAAGERRELDRLAAFPVTALENWVRQSRPSRNGIPRVTLDAVIFSTGASSLSSPAVS